MIAKICKRSRMNQVEDDGHFLSRCTFNNNLVTNRHDDVVKKIAKELMKSNPNAKLWRERSWRSRTELMRPDNDGQ